MEWVETTGRTIEEAKEAALDQLGVDEQDAEFEVLEQPKPGLFGRMRSEARVRARVRPTTPRPKDDRRRRRPRSEGRAEGGGEAADAAGKGGVALAEDPGGSDEAVLEDGATARSGARDSRSGNGRSGNGRTGRRPRRRDEEGDPGMTVQEDEVPLETQGEVAREFVAGLLERFGAEGAGIEVRMVDEETVEVAVDGPELGFLIGSRGGTLQAIQELARTVVQRRTGARTGWVTVDVSGYRQKRKDALQRFAREVAQQVLDSGSRKALEPMSPADRKIVHDTINDIDGVTTTSEGEEPRRRVVLLPED